MAWLWLLPAAVLTLFILRSDKSAPPSSKPALPPGSLQPGASYRITLNVTADDVATAQHLASVLLSSQGFSSATCASTQAALGGTYVLTFTGTFAGGQDALVSVPPVTVYSVQPAVVYGPPVAIDVSKPITLVPNSRYLAKATVSAPLAWVVTTDAIKAKLGEQGFNPVSVWGPNDRTPSIFPDMGVPASGDTYFVAADWASPAQALSLPGQVTRLWVMQPAAILRAAT